MYAEFTADEILNATASRLESGNINGGKGNLVWDFGEIKPGDWFIALPSANDDPHDCLELAFHSGARGVIVNRRARYASAPQGATIITVPDTTLALLDLARRWRQVVSPKVVGVTGSFGRRATMMLLNQLLQSQFRPHLAFVENMGRLSCVREVLAMPKDTQVLIFEAGAIERGDITRIGGTLEPDLAVLTQIRHPLPSAARDAFVSALYCELLETVVPAGEDVLSAVIYDDNLAVQERIDAIAKDMNTLRFSKGIRSIAGALPDASVQALSAVMQSAIGQSVTRAEIWSAVEAARTLGISDAVLFEVFELQNGFDSLVSAAPFCELHS